MKIGELLEDYRKKRDLSYRQLALEIDCDHTTLWRLLTDRMTPEMEVVVKVMLWLLKTEPKVAKPILSEK